MADGGFGKKVEDFGQNVWKKAQGAVDIVSLNNDISTKKREVEQLYAEIGEAYCTERPDEVGAAYADRYNRVRMLLEEIETLEERVQRKKGVKKCENCGTLVPLAAEYCSKCGARVLTPEPEPDATVVIDPYFCADCGTTLNADDKFCPRCGKQRE